MLLSRALVSQAQALRLAPPDGGQTAQKQDPWSVRGKSCLELGCGTGLAGLTAIALDCNDCTFTDCSLPALCDLRLSLALLSDDARHKAHIRRHVWESDSPDNFGKPVRPRHTHAHTWIEMRTQRYLCHALSHMRRRFNCNDIRRFALKHTHIHTYIHTYIQGDLQQDHRKQGRAGHATNRSSQVRPARLHSHRLCAPPNRLHTPRSRPLFVVQPVAFAT